MLFSLYNFKIFGCTPFKFIWGALTDVGTWTGIWAIIIIAVMLSVARKFGLIKFIADIVNIGLKIIITMFTIIKTVIIESYLLILMNIDAKKNCYDLADYWSSRKITADGVKCCNFRQTNNRLIKHPKLIMDIMYPFLVGYKIFRNVRYRCLSHFQK